MLGRIIGRSRWIWSAFGKHPVAKDYFQMNLDSPMAGAFAKWVDTGFQQLSEDRRRQTVCSWRFWARGQKKGTTVCGLGKSCSDSFGRPYPMVIMGEGALDQWEKEWDLMLAGLQSTWETLEYATTRRFRDLEQLDFEIRNLPSPNKRWQQTRKMDTYGLASEAHEWKKIILSDVRKKIQQLEIDGQLLIPLDGQPLADPFQMATAWHVALKECGSAIPNTVFMGGKPDTNLLALYIRPLVANDFSTLWSI